MQLVDAPLEYDRSQRGWHYAEDPLNLFELPGLWLTGGDNNIFTQISLFVLAGLASKNAILIVEFAREQSEKGDSLYDATLHAARMRLRPIIMTSLAFTLGVVPLVLSTGAGAEMRAAMGLAVFCGMIGVTFFGIFMTPVFYVLLRKLAGERPLRQHIAVPEDDDPVVHHAPAE